MGPLTTTLSLLPFVQETKLKRFWKEEKLTLQGYLVHCGDTRHSHGNAVWTWTKKSGLEGKFKLFQKDGSCFFVVVFFKIILQQKWQHMSIGAVYILVNKDNSLLSLFVYLDKKQNKNKTYLPPNRKHKLSLLFSETHVNIMLCFWVSELKGTWKYKESGKICF